MITEKQLIELYNTGKVLKCDNFYYAPFDTKPSYQDIIKANSLQIALSEWFEVYNYRESGLLENNIKYGIPIISEEDCYRMGL